MGFGNFAQPLLWAAFGLAAFGMPLTTHFSARYAGQTMLVTGVVLCLEAYAYLTAMAGRRLFQEGFPDR